MANYPVQKALRRLGTRLGELEDLRIQEMTCRGNFVESEESFSSSSSEFEA